MQTISKFPEFSELSCLTSLHVELFLPPTKRPLENTVALLQFTWNGEARRTLFYSFSFSRFAYFISILAAYDGWNILGEVRVSNGNSYNTFGTLRYILEK